MSKWVTVMSAGNGGKLILDAEQINMIDVENSCIYIGTAQVELADFELNEILNVIGLAGRGNNDNVYGDNYYNT